MALLWSWRGMETSACLPWQVTIWQTISISSRPGQQSSEHAVGFENRIASPHPEMRIRIFTGRRAKTQLCILVSTCWRKALAFTEVNLVLAVFMCLIETLELHLPSKMPVSVALHNALLNFSGFSSVVSTSSLWTWMVKVFLKIWEINLGRLFTKAENYFLSSWVPSPPTHPSKQASKDPGFVCMI